ncbi:hypothetical protein EV652_106461 [Kribbella steppae]|uniref:Uncharacterized protein n=1 Tax=Kribbella steppae TaxID=2512223 RepID=A0A4R2HL35_9ACTN|nr:hypothetical protein EV652_106461 [Kribbella steppae]
MGGTARCEVAYDGERERGGVVGIELVRIEPVDGLDAWFDETGAVVGCWRRQEVEDADRAVAPVVAAFGDKVGDVDLEAGFLEGLAGCCFGRSFAGLHVSAGQFPADYAEALMANHQDVAC